MSAIYGTVTFTNDLKGSGGIAISTSWSHEKAFTQSGKYRWEFKTGPKRNITISANGKIGTGPFHVVAEIATIAQFRLDSQKENAHLVREGKICS